MFQQQLDPLNQDKLFEKQVRMHVEAGSTRSPILPAEQVPQPRQMVSSPQQPHKQFQQTETVSSDMMKLLMQLNEGVRALGGKFDTY